METYNVMLMLYGQNTFPFLPSRLFGWSNNYIDINRFTGEKQISYVQKSHKNMALSGSQVIEAYIPS